MIKRGRRGATVGGNDVGNLRSKTCRRVGRCLYTVVFCTLATGCGGSQRESQEREESNLKPLAIFYGQFTGQHRGRPPSDEDEFKQFIRSLGSEQLATFGVTDPESLFISSRDQKPYVIIYGGAARSAVGTLGGPSRVVAYEQVGKDGLRLVANDLGAVEEVDEARFREMVPDAP